MAGMTNCRPPNLSLNLFHQTGHRTKIHQTSRVAFDASDDKFAFLFTTFIRLGERANGQCRPTHLISLPSFPIPPCQPALRLFFFPPSIPSHRLQTAAAHIFSSSPLDYSTPAGRSVVKTHLQERIDNPDFYIVLPTRRVSPNTSSVHFFSSPIPRISNPLLSFSFILE